MVLSNVLTKKRIEFTLLQFLFWASFAISPFTVVYLTEQGLSNTSIGLMLSINSLIGIISQPFWGMASDWLKSVKRVFIFCFAVSTIVFVVLPSTHSTLLIGTILSINTFFKSSVVSLLDIWMISSISEEENISYGSLRLWGSIGFAIMVLVFGKIANGRSLNLIFPIYFAVSVVTIVLCLNIRSTNVVIQNKFKEFKPGILLKNYYFMTFVIFVFFISIPNTPTGSFLPVLFEHVGGTTEQYGMMHSIKAFMEIPFFLFGDFFLKKFGNKKVIIFAALIYTLQQFMFANATSPVQVIVAQMLLGPAYSLFLIGMLYYILELSPDGYQTTAQTLANALGMSLSSIIGNYGGGIFIDRFGLKPMFQLGLVNDIITVILFAGSLIIGKKLFEKRNPQNICK